MVLAPDDIVAIEGLLGQAKGEPGAVDAVRAQFPDLSMTRCDQSDVDAEDPFREYPDFNLYLVDGTDHCWRLTADPSAATGIVIAKKWGQS
ncbi:hypothetical protein AUC70_04805 [Methyloceanibacter stevinii]|uniref:Uncharacterized protein n=1 Tax=Methyloceanibacter stevinii TaxID=1774970 RepID=A0A1E3VNF7_9HYPH|nr:hypothetical protein [Methyloceanibacter stevinii]ODR95063.1 hypothetical protein AUC70_04805 [Methyloceanibacter stevinii]